MNGGIAEKVGSPGIVGKFISPVNRLTTCGGKPADGTHLTTTVAGQADTRSFSESRFVGLTNRNRIARR